MLRAVVGHHRRKHYVHQQYRRRKQEKGRVDLHVLMLAYPAREQEPQQEVDQAVKVRVDQHGEDVYVGRQRVTVHADRDAEVETGYQHDQVERLVRQVLGRVRRDAAEHDVHPRLVVTQLHHGYGHQEQTEEQQRRVPRVVKQHGEQKRRHESYRRSAHGAQPEHGTAFEPVREQPRRHQQFGHEQQFVPEQRRIEVKHQRSPRYSLSARMKSRRRVRLSASSCPLTVAILPSMAVTCRRLMR